MGTQPCLTPTKFNRAITPHGRLDVLVTVPIVPPATPAETLPLARFHQDIATNLGDVFFWSQAAAEQMSKQMPAGGCIINISSVGGVLGLPGKSAFSAAMAGVDAMTQTLATEWHPLGIRVVGVGAGLVPELHRERHYKNGSTERHDARTLSDSGQDAHNRKRCCTRRHISRERGGTAHQRHDRLYRWRLVGGWLLGVGAKHFGERIFAKMLCHNPKRHDRHERQGGSRHGRRPRIWARPMPPPCSNAARRSALLNSIPNSDTPVKTI